MPAVVVGGVTIPVAASAPGKQDMDDGVDRGRAFNNTYRASATGGAARDFRFTTPPLLRSDADIYDIALRTLAPQTCAGDIIALPTMCCAERTGWTPVTVKGGHRVILDFTLHEVQPALALLKYTPGDTISGESFARSTTAYYHNQGGGATPLSQAAIDVKRDAHWLSGIRTTLLEGFSTNNLLWANDFSNGAWVKTTTAVTTGIADPAGGTTACTLTSSSTNSHCIQTLSAGSSLARTNSIWARRRSGSGAVNLRDAPNTAVIDIGTGLPSVWTRFSIPSAASTARSLDVQMLGNGDAIDVWCAQQEDTPFPSSEIPTTSATVTRGADLYGLPFTVPPQEMTVYAKFIELGTALSSTRVFSITNAASGRPQFAVFSNAGLYTVYDDNGTTILTPGLAAGPALNDNVELLPRLFGDGSADITQSINGGASSASAQSAANALQASWAGQFVWLHSSGNAGGFGFTAIQSFKIVAGSRSLTEMRAA